MQRQCGKVLGDLLSHDSSSGVPFGQNHPIKAMATGIEPHTTAQGLKIGWDSNAYGSIVWTLLGLHTTHIITDLVDTLVLAALMFTRHGDNRRRYGDVQDNAMYWNFVVAAWLPIYACIYWIPRL